MTEDIWSEQDKRFFDFEKDVQVPDEQLSQVDVITLRSESDFEKVPDKGGCYWIWTNEPIYHQ